MISLPKCRYCQCDELHPCPGGCSWWKPEYCSACAEKHLKQLAKAALDWTMGAGGRGSTNKTLGARPYAIVVTTESIVVSDHLGLVIFELTDDGAFLAPHYDAPELMPLFAGEARRAA